MSNKQENIICQKTHSFETGVYLKINAVIVKKLMRKTVDLCLIYIHYKQSNISNNTLTADTDRLQSVNNSHSVSYSATPKHVRLHSNMYINKNNNGYGNITNESDNNRQKYTEN